MRSKWVNLCGKLICAAGLAVGVVGTGAGQNLVSSSDVATELRVLSGHAETMFVGQIVAIENQGGVVEVHFRVEQAIRGDVGATFTMREWSGLWPAGHVRYTVGQRVLAFVNGTSAAGFNSPVHGAEGLVPVVVQGANAQRLLDVRRVAASVVRAPGAGLPMEANGALPLGDALGWINTPANGSGGERGLLPVPTRGRKPVLEQGTGTVEQGTGTVAELQNDSREDLQGPRARPIQQGVFNDLR